MYNRVIVYEELFFFITIFFRCINILYSMAYYLIFMVHTNYNSRIFNWQIYQKLCYISILQIFWTKIFLVRRMDGCSSFLCKVRLLFLTKYFFYHERFERFMVIHYDNYFDFLFIIKEIEIVYGYSNYLHRGYYEGFSRIQFITMYICDVGELIINNKMSGLNQSF